MSMKVRRRIMAIFKGSGVAIVTPFKEDGSIDYDKLDELIDYHCENKTDSIIICGTTGESATMTEEEHMDCVKFAIERTKKRIPVVAGTGFELYENGDRHVQRSGRERCRWAAGGNALLQ